MKLARYFAITFVVRQVDGVLVCFLPQTLKAARHLGSSEPLRKAQQDGEKLLHG